MGEGKRKKKSLSWLDIGASKLHCDLVRHLGVPPVSGPGQK